MRSTSVMLLLVGGLVAGQGDTARGGTHAFGWEDMFAMVRLGDPQEIAQLPGRDALPWQRLPAQLDERLDDVGKAHLLHLAGQGGH